EFLELFLPEIASTVELDSARFLQQEYFVDLTSGEEKVIDLLVEVKQFYGTRTRPNENAAFRVTQQYKEALMQFVYDKQSVSDYADLLAVTPNHLNRCIKAVTGKSAQELLSDMIVMEVKALLRQTSLSISEIAFKIGKEDPSDFTRFFKSKTGMPPSEYRQIA
ncbi:MAG: AraC family transcriptional regulator, partial [Flavisolibacter sp.]|nr:AraC family transcriptional regulator [Flavisolibacter sp.]